MRRLWFLEMQTVSMIRYCHSLSTHYLRNIICVGILYVQTVSMIRYCHSLQFCHCTQFTIDWTYDYELSNNDLRLFHLIYRNFNFICVCLNWQQSHWNWPLDKLISKRQMKYPLMVNNENVFKVFVELYSYFEKHTT